MHHYNDMLYSNDYVEFGLELVEGSYFIHVNILKKDKDTRDQVRKTWLGLQEYLLSKGITEVYALIDDDNTRLKEFSSDYGFKREYTLESNEEVWVGELN